MARTENQLQEILLKILEIYECKNIAHLPSENSTNIDRLWLSYFNDHEKYNVILLPNSQFITLPGRHPYRMCVTSFSAWNLKNATFVKDRVYERPIKIHIDLNNDQSVPIEYWYGHNGTNFEAPPVISIRLRSQRKHKVFFYPLTKV